MALLVLLATALWYLAQSAVQTTGGHQVVPKVEHWNWMTP